MFWIYLLIYLLIGEFITFLMWIFFEKKEFKDEVNVLFYFPLVTFLWPLVIIGRLLNFITYISISYVR